LFLFSFFFVFFLFFLHQFSWAVVSEKEKKEKRTGPGSWVGAVCGLEILESAVPVGRSGVGANESDFFNE
jgi:hypothetical protein